ncbi:Arc family DNA-binding protein [Bradyrhizobium sp. CSS354]|uniref:Arc family DNA-binding protein n=1 Tax=Bradyrhizobium sp. CSS354 TaxID=2699172 RepID=UPI0023B18083|nr:Arc family DNA-binding protein [Bradyrhizobium sp. CSS354]MDE5460185.1 Arc family DNA-binding protein [Bradyrhizobium sp. CSS354]
MARKLTETVQFKLRFSEELRRKLEKAAEKNDQSMNLEIIERLEASFRQKELLDALDAQARALADDLRKEMADSLRKELRQQIFAAMTGKPAETVPPADETPKGLLAALGYSLKPDGNAK